jgi:type-F conjugative transfer system mating-pair stabilization protein TraN
VVKRVLSLLLIIVSASAGAQTQQDHADDASNWGGSNNAPVVEATETTEPAAVVPGYEGTATPLSDYYDRQSAGNLEADGINAVIVSPDPTTKYAWDQANTPILEFSETDPLLVDSWAIQDNTAVVEGELVLTRTDCVDSEVETPETTVERCTAWTLAEQAFCDNALDVTVDENPQTYTAIVQVENDVGRAVSNILHIIPNLNDPTWAVDFGIGSNGEYIGSARVVNALGLPGDFDCSTIADVKIDIVGIIDFVETPVCTTGGVFSDITYGSGPRSGGTVTYTITAGATPVYTDTWTDGCPALMDECEAQAPAACIEGPEERLITASNGEPYTVFRDCWRYRTPLLCAGSVTTDAGYCDELLARGCSPLDTECDDGTCEHTYECPLDGWTEPAEDCSDTTFGLSGIEFDTSVEPSTEFGQAAANLQAMEEAVLDMDSAGVSCIETPAGSGEYDCVGELLIFNGEDLRCKKKALGFSNCCSRDGWGLGWADNCNSEEEQLRLARREGQCVYVGSYCSEDSIFGCLAKKETHCCFRSKLARIIQEQGREQLRLAWGGAESPECDGFTGEQLAAVDFSVIDFSEYFADAFANITGSPDNATMESIIDAYIATLSVASASGCSQFDPGYPDC